MLHSLTIHNYLFVKNLQLNFHKGFTVLTGETGAGKSILLEALNFALGARPHVQPSEKDPIDITVSFKITSLPSPLKIFFDTYQVPFTDNTITLKRTLSAKGQSTAFLNDRKVPLTMLKEIGKSLIDIHGQFDSLLSSAMHTEILDSFAHLTQQRTHLIEKFHLWKHHQKTLEDLEKSLHTLNQEKEWLEHAVEEFQKIAPQDNEETILLEKRTALMEFSKTADTLKNLQDSVGESSVVENTLQSTLRTLHKTTTEEQKSLWKCKELIEKMVDVLAEVHQELEGAHNNLEGSLEDNLNAIESRLFSLRDLARKHNSTVNDLPHRFHQLTEKLETLKHGNVSLVHLEKQMHEAKENYHKEALILSQARHKAAELLKEKIQHILASLKLPYVNFHVNFEPLPDHQWTGGGIEKIEFWVSLNVGIPAGPLKNVASGGELSRLMLALKVLAQDQNTIQTLIFDEIDTGLGGAVAASMGKYLKQIARHAQVMAITHSPQLAAYGEHHLHVLKTSTTSHTHLTMAYLQAEEEKSLEIARMLSGKEITEQTKAAAIELRQGALHDQPV